MTSGTIGAGLSAGMSKLSGESNGQAAIAGGKGFVGGLATTSGGAFTKEGSISRAAAQGVAAFNATRATGGSNFKATVAGLATAATSFYRRPSSAVQAGAIAGQVAAQIERKGLSTLIKSLFGDKSSNDQK